MYVLDSGHGGEDPGKIGVNQAKEKDVNLKIAKKTKERLEKKGWKVVMTREKDVMLGDPAAGNKKIHDMKARVERINKTMPQAAVSIHQNSYSDPGVKGPQVFYYEDSEGGKELALAIQENMNRKLSIARPRVGKRKQNLLSSEEKSGCDQYRRMWISYKSGGSCPASDREVSEKGSRGCG